MALDEDFLPLREDTPNERRREKRRSRRVLVAALLLLGILLALVVGGLLRWGGGLDYDRIPGAFDLPDAVRPVDDPGEPTQLGRTFLLAGTDRRASALTTGEEAEAPTWLPGAQRSDVIMLVHVSEDGKSAYVVSIPRDSWVDIPGYGLNKINAAFSFGGPALYVQTIEQLTDTRIDHLAVIDWNGLTQLVDVLGGVELTFDRPTVGGPRTWPAGTHRLSGEEVRDYVRERSRLPRGDFDRVERQQNVLRALSGQLIAAGTLGNPAKAFEVASAARQMVSVDDTLSIADMVSIALQSRGLATENITYLTVPTSGTGTEGSQSVVYLDEPAQDGFWESFRSDSLEEWVEQNGARTTPADVS